MLSSLAMGWLALGCGSGGSPDSTSAALVGTLTPDPIVETPCPPADCGTLAGQLEASASLALRETAGVGALLDSVTMTLRSDATGAVIAAGAFQGPGLAQQAGGAARIDPRGSRVVAVAVHHDASLGGHPATLSVVAAGTDDRGHSVSASVHAAVSP